MHTRKQWKLSLLWKKLKERPKNDGVMGHRKYPQSRKGAWRKWFKFRAFCFWRHVNDRMWRELKHARPKWREYAARAFWRSSAVCSRHDTVNGFEQGLFVSFFFVLNLMSVKKKKQLEERCQPLSLICKTSEEKRPCRTRSNDVDMSIRGLCECPELAHGPLVNMLNSTCNKTNGLVSCLTCISMWNKLSRNWQKLSDSSIWALKRSLLCKDGETTSLAWSAFMHLCSSQGSTYFDQAICKSSNQILTMKRGTDRKSRQPKKKKKRKRKRTARNGAGAPAETPFPDIPRAPLEDLDSSAKMKINLQLEARCQPLN